MSCKILIINPYTAPGTLRKANDNQRSVAELGIISIQAPSSVQPGQIFQIKCTYKFCRKLNRNTVEEGWEGALYPTPLEKWPEYHGAFRRCLRGVPALCTRHAFWIWRFLVMKLYHQGQMVASHAANDLNPGDTFTYTWSGTIEQLTGKEFPEPAVVEGQFDLTGWIYGWYGEEDWPWSWLLKENWLQEVLVDSLKYTIQVDVYVPPPPPYPIFDLNYCSISKTQVKPNETFTIKVRIVNQNDNSGKYIIGCICEAKYQKLGDGMIAGKATVNRTFNVTANQLAQRAIIERQFLSFTITAENEEQKTYQWTPPAIAVIVSEPEPIAQLSGWVTDKNTGAGIAAVTVAIVGRTTSTSPTGYYSFADLAPGAYTITFTKSGYWTETKTKTLYEGANTLNAIMTSTTEPEPGEGIPWNIIALGGVALGAILIVSRLRRKK